MLVASGVIYLVLGSLSAILSLWFVVAGNAAGAGGLIDAALLVLVGVCAMRKAKFVMAKAGLVIFGGLVLAFGIYRFCQTNTTLNLAIVIIELVALVLAALGWQAWNRAQKDASPASQSP